MTNKQIVHRPIHPFIVEVVENHPQSSESVLEVLKDVQARGYHLGVEVITDIARCLNLSPQQVFGVASFYSLISLEPQSKNVIRVCEGPVCWLCGGDEIRKLIDNHYGENEDWKVEQTSCLGLCDRAPAVLVNELQAGPLSDINDVSGIRDNWQGSDRNYSQPKKGELRVMLANMGRIDPQSLDSALAFGAYEGLEKVLNQNPVDVVVEVEASGLTGRGGAGFPVGRKWRFTSQAQKHPKYVVCNADESEPLIFKDRVLINTNPHQILEGMAIAGYAIGARQGYIYIRGEYEKQAQLLENAIIQAKEAGWLGENIHGSSYSFHLHVHRGAGAYICGEETGLIESLEGKRGEPRNRPPYPPSSGFHGLPTLVNNVESFAAVPAIIVNGAQWYRSLSSAVTPGTKLWMVLGHVKKPGLFEAPFGLTLRQIINDYGGGMIPGSKFNFALAGGASGLFVPPDLMDVPIDYGSVTKGVSIGAGSFLICDQRVSPVELLSKLLLFFKFESCGKCTPCRVGTHRSYEILKSMVSGYGKQGDIQELQSLADVMYDASFCGLGQSVPMPIRSALAHFEDDFLNLEK